MDRVLEIDILPTPQVRNSQTLEPGSPATGFLPEEMGDDEARIQSSCTPSGVVVHRLPAEIWMAICDALRQFDLIEIKLRSLVLWKESWRDEPSIPINWISQLIGTTMQDLSFDASELVPPVLPVLPGLEFLEFPATVYRNLISPSMLCGVLSKTPNLKEAVFAVKAAQGDPVNKMPALSHLERIVCHASWLRFLIPRRPITTAEVLCDSQVRVQGLFEILHQGSVPLRDLTLTYANEWPDPTWSPDDLEPAARYLPELEILRLRIQDPEVRELFEILHKSSVPLRDLTLTDAVGWGPQRWSPDDLQPAARYLPELEILRLRIQDPEVAGLQQALFYISQLQKFRIVSFSFRKESSRYDGGLLDDVRQELKLRELIGLTRSPFLERVSFGEECEWRSEDPGLWILRQGGRMVRFVSL